ncbi:AbrB/MazE/SpoVT family DNA-binding domain-containing protein [Paenibacillus alkaliterrae]|uniref:AbrB/MazE/SpoVT family DNA-binding domain-containing protein n=1 Tax=Paenibacillus alkaliterrae TaxID=320909 RepID=UPI001F2E442F|nr:AbrB/MazE/SpoVT family DNA-binding domain-containing protein [Paenibacillus alkaliterrae]MCF2940402.1 AbrB/MazE/SpoVT family DNA-binding domain-containing protein [Paenibacillus alkaliterrae]
MGNSLGVSLPKALAEQLKITQGDEIEFIVNEEGDVMLRKVRKSKLPENVRPEVLEAFYDMGYKGLKKNSALKRKSEYN